MKPKSKAQPPKIRFEKEFHFDFSPQMMGFLLHHNSFHKVLKIAKNICMKYFTIIPTISKSPKKILLGWSVNYPRKV